VERRAIPIQICQQALVSSRSRMQVARHLDNRVKHSDFLILAPTARCISPTRVANCWHASAAHMPDQRHPRPSGDGQTPAREESSYDASCQRHELPGLPLSISGVTLYGGYGSLAS
jgi:hypothetical protein